ncbi:Hypothetical protein FKW44_012892, partial [Caligus rogercresseyi]
VGKVRPVFLAFQVDPAFKACLAIGALKGLEVNLDLLGFQGRVMGCKTIRTCT